MAETITKRKQAGKAGQASSLSVKASSTGFTSYKSVRLGNPNSGAEREADQKADQITRTTATSCLKSNHSALDAPALTQNAHPLLGDSGHQLDDSAQQWLQDRFQTDFSNIRIHTNERAQQSADSMHARAYTLGNHIVFSKGEYQPHSTQGKHLLAHELTHSLQQTNSPRVQHKTPPVVQRSLKTYISAMNEKPEPNWALAAEHLNGENIGTIRIILKRLPEMYRAKLHKAARSWPGICSNISRLTEKEYLKHIDPAAKKVDDSCGPISEQEAQREKPKPKAKSKSSGKSKLRKKNRALRKKSPAEIMKDSNYFENGIKSIDYYYGDWAILNFDDGSTMKLGLVPEHIKSPIQGVDFRSLKSEHLVISPPQNKPAKGKIKFVPRGNEAIYPEDFTVKDVQKELPKISQTIKFKYHNNGRIVPTIVNSITAPRLTHALREADRVYIAGFTAMAKQLKVMEWILIVRSLAVSGAKPARGAGITSKVLSQAESKLSTFFAQLLKSGQAGNIVVEGVSFGAIRVAQAGSELVVTRTFIQNVSRIPGRGRLIHAAFEQAAIQTAKSVGAKTARVSLELVQNPKWSNYLLGTGKYAIEVVKSPTGFTRVLTKVFTL